MDHSPYHPSVMPSDFHFFGLLKKCLASKQFATDTSMQQAVSSWLQTLDTNIFYARIQALVSRWNKCLHVNNDYMEVWCVLSTTHVPLYQSQNTFSKSGCLLPYFLY